MTVRRGNPTDRLWVVEMAKRAHAAGQLPWPYSAPHAELIFKSSLVMPDQCCIILDREGERCGFLIGYVSLTPMASVAIARDLGFWIEPHARGGSGAVQMVKDFEAWAYDRGAQFSSLAAMLVNEKAGRLYERMGYDAIETHYLKALS